MTNGMGINIELIKKHRHKNTKYKPTDFAEAFPRHTLFEGLIKRGFLTNELRGASYELLFIVRVMS